MCILMKESIHENGEHSWDLPFLSRGFETLPTKDKPCQEKEAVTLYNTFIFKSLSFLLPLQNNKGRCDLEYGIIKVTAL